MPFPSLLCCASRIVSGYCSKQSTHLPHSIDLFNSSLSSIDALTIDTVSTSMFTQKMLSCKLEDKLFTQLFNNASLPDRACLLSVSSRHSSAWLFVTPSLRLNLHLDPSEFQVAIKWWLGLPACQGQICPQCSSHSLDYFGHHALTGRKGPDVVHNRIRDTIFELGQLACLGAQLEPEAVWVMKKDKPDRLISSFLTGSWDNMLQLTFPSHPRFVMTIFK